MRISDWSSDVCSSDFSVIVCSSKSRIFQSLFTEGPVAREGAGEQFFNSCRGDFAGVAVGILGRKPRSLGDAIEGHAEGLERLRGPQLSLTVEQPLRSVGYAGCGRDAALGVLHRRRIICERSAESCVG